MIILRNKSFSLRERNRVRGKGDSRKEALMERNLGLEKEIIESPEQNTFHQDRPTTHSLHFRPRLEKR